MCQRRQLSTSLVLVSLLSLVVVKLDNVCGEVFTAISDMEELLETEAVLIANLEGFINVQEEKLANLRRINEDYQREHTEASMDIGAYISNPINAYLLTKRLTSDWNRIEQIMTLDVGRLFIQNITSYRDTLKFPSEEDLQGAAIALMRLQDMYQLETASVASGQLNGIQYSKEMSASDCFELGRQSYVTGDYYHTVLWMSEAMDRFMNEVNRTSSKAEILEYLAFSTYKQGNVRSALEMTNELLELNPGHERAIGNKLFYEKQITSEDEANKSTLRGDDGTDGVPVEEVVREVSNPNVFDLPERRLYEMMCRGDIKKTPQELSKLHCKYLSNNSPFLKIAPFKVEEANLDPYILVFHDVLYDPEIEVIKTLAKPRFRRATVQNYKTGALEAANYRISKSAWLRDYEHDFIARITRRIEDMTGLSMKSAEELQVANYGIGGHYEPHFDFARRSETQAFKGLNSGNRIATVLFYMSDVALGGATVFPSLRTALYPKKGTAAFWFNLHKTGDGDLRTRHAACPVLAGNKWVSNKWIHEREQEFRRPCDLVPDYVDDQVEEGVQSTKTI